MKQIKILLKEKGSKVFTISPNDTVYKAIETLSAKDIGALVVTDDDKVVGIFTERDYAREVILKDRSSQKTIVSEIMNTDVVYVLPEHTVSECMALMTDKRIRHLPVIDNGKLIGMISIGDLVKSIISEQEFTIEQLENYIRG